MSERGRIYWIDWIKVFACVLVVLGHFYMSMKACGYCKETEFFYCWPIQTIYTFHVPLFFVCSGFLYQNSNKRFEKREHLSVIETKLLNFGVPYFAFSAITLLLKNRFSSDVNNPATPFFKTLFLEPTAPYWFLYALFFVFLIIPRFRSENKLQIACAVSFLLKILYILHSQWSAVCPYAVHTLLLNTPWFLYGMSLTVFLRRRRKANRWVPWAALLLGIAGSSIVYRRPNQSEMMKMLFGCIFVFSITELAWQHEKRFETQAAVLDKLSQIFMPVFLMHTIAAATARTFLFRCGIASLWVHVFVGIPASFLLPLLIYQTAKKHWLLLFWIEPKKAFMMRKKGRKRKKRYIKEEGEKILNRQKCVQKSLQSHTLAADSFGYLLTAAGFADQYLAGQVTMYRAYTWLKKKFGREVGTFAKAEQQPAQKDYVWFCWLQGMENAPEIVQSCYESVNYWLKGKEMIVITRHNLSEYVLFPQYILDKWEQGIITDTHLSDLLRLELLIRYGGLWLDATTYLTGPLPRYAQESDFFVFRNGWMDMETLWIGSWLMLSKRTNNILLLETRNLLYKYWQKYDYLKNYFLLHLFFRMAAEAHCAEWESVLPVNHVHSHLLMQELPHPYHQKRCEQIKQLTSIHKLTYKFTQKIEEDSTASRLHQLYKEK
jgi:fucose 4-O-acetylase-like acetyltransferase